MLLKALSRTGKVEESVRHLRSLIDADSLSYEYVIAALVKDKDIDRAEKIFLDMKSKKLEGTPTTWRYVIEGLLRSKQVDKVPPPPLIPVASSDGHL